MSDAEANYGQVVLAVDPELHAMVKSMRAANRPLIYGFLEHPEPGSPKTYVERGDHVGPKYRYEIDEYRVWCITLINFQRVEFSISRHDEPPFTNLATGEEHGRRRYYKVKLDHLIGAKDYEDELLAAAAQFGVTQLTSGNVFLEVCMDADDEVDWAYTPWVFKEFADFFFRISVPEPAWD